jgi:hypothetical protein
MANLGYNRGKYLLIGTADLLAITIKAALIASGYTPLATHNFMSDVTNEVSGTNYSSGFAGTGRQTLGTPAITEDDGNNLAKFSSANIVFTSVNGFTAAGMVLYKHLTSDAASELLVWIDGGFPFTANGGTITITPHANGWFYIT